jgi:ATP-dependent DNA ligase
MAPKEVCENSHHMQQFLQDIIDVGGEGIILRDPLAPYQPGRSPGFLKHKVSFSFCLFVD